MIKSPNNAEWNVRNEYQTQVRKVLCVCSAGILRSPTMAALLTKYWAFNTRACGTDKNYALVPLSTALVKWADQIVFVNPDNYNEAKLLSNESVYEELLEKSIVLEIEDDYKWMQPELVELLMKELIVWFGKPEGEEE